MKMMVLLVLQTALLSSENTLSSNPCMPKGEPRGLAKGEVLKRRSMSGPEETMGGTLAPRQKSMRGGGGGAPAMVSVTLLVFRNTAFPTGSV